MKVDLPVVGTQQQKASAAQVAGRRMHHGQRKAGGHGGVYRVAARAQHLNAGIRGQVMDADHHAMRRAHRLLVAIGYRVLRALLGGEENGERRA